ncbi:MAG: PAS domain S-box protein [Balneolaceae bacterium]|nr:MAG: PAS domain S-box protein [Balneolaceae bacterium]
MAEHSADNPTGSPPEDRHREELEKLRRSERFLRSILETQEDLLCRFLPDTTLTFVNEPYCRIFGRTAEELVGTRFLDLIPRDSHMSVRETLSRLSASNRSVTYSHEVILPGDRTGWQEWTYTAIIGGDGKVVEIQSTGRDITRQKKVENELMLQTRLQELLMKISATYISIPESEVDAAIHKSLAELGQFAGADRFYIFRYDFDRNTSTNTHEWCAPGIGPQIANLQDYPMEHIPDWVDTHRKGEMMYVPNVFALPKDSSIRQVLEPQGIKSLIAVPMMDRSECVGFVGLDYVRAFQKISVNERKLLTIFAQMMVNVQNRIRTQKSLVENERFLSDLIDNSGSIIAVKNADGTYHLVNRKWQEITGIRREDALGRTDDGLFEPELARGFMENDRHVLATGETIEFEETFNEGTDVRHFLSTKFPVRDVKGAITGVCSMIFEITDRKKAEQHRLARSEAEAANRAKGTLLSNMSHEIRTPLNAIIGFARVMERDQALNDRQAEQIRTILSSSEQLLTLVNQTLDYSKIEAGAETVNPARFHIRTLINDVFRMFVPRAERKGLRYATDIDPRLPDFIYADEAKLRQILVNLLSNAIKVTGEGSVTLRADFPGKPGRNDRIQLVFEIEDTGPGIAKSDIRQLFSKYYQLKDGLRAGGTGLGLAISKKLTHLLEGTIEVDSTPGKGSTFRLTLPVSITDGTDLVTDTEQKHITRLARGAGVLKVLVADDRETNRQLLRSILEPAGFVVREAPNGEEAAALHDSWKPDAVLMDLRMPVMDGVKATGLIRATDTGNHIPVIGLTSGIMRSRRTGRDTRGLDGYISQPVDPDELLTLLGSLLNVPYHTDEPPAEHRTAAGKKLLTRQAITGLSAGTIHQIRSAILEGDMIGLRRLADNLEPEFATVRAGIRELAAAYDYDTLLALFEDPGNSNP